MSAAEKNGGKRAGAVVRAEMAEQPEVLARLLQRRGEVAAALEPLGGRTPDGVLLVARGSSDNAATYARYLFELALGRPVALSANSLFTRYGCHTRLEDWLVVAISQSGATPEIVEVVEATRELGAVTLAVTNEAESELAASAHGSVVLGAGRELAVPATKTYLATLLALALLAEAAGRSPWPAGALSGLPEQVAGLLEAEGDVDGAVELLLDGAPSVHLGRGLLFCAALESALKMRETARLPVQGYSVADFLHGPIAATDAETVAVCHAGNGPTRGDIDEVSEALAAYGARIVVVGPSPASRPAAAVPVPDVDESLAAILHGVRGQQLAVSLSLARGLDPDSPEGLSKVTATS